MCVCFNCGSLEYPSKKITYIASNLRQLRDCRAAWRVFERLIIALARKLDVDVNEVFRFEKKGRDKAEVFACGKCRSPQHQDVEQYGLYGLGAPLPRILANAALEERLALSVVKMADATFEGYSGVVTTNTRAAASTVQTTSSAASLLSFSKATPTTTQHRA